MPTRRHGTPTQRGFQLTVEQRARAGVRAARLRRAERERELARKRAVRRAT